MIHEGQLNRARRASVLRRHLRTSARERVRMTVLKSRTRSVTFRLSLDEFELLKQVCIATKARSVSDFTREAVLDRVAMRLGENISLSTDLRTLNGRLQALDSVLRDTRGQIAKILGSESEGKTQE